MQKKGIIAIVITTLAIGTFYLKYFFKPAINISHNKIVLNSFADDRLSYKEFKEEIEVKINILFEDITKFNTIPTKKQLQDLVQNIKTLRAYGKDISQNSKIKLLKALKKLVDNHYKNIDILKELIDISKTSQNLVA